MHGDSEFPWDVDVQFNIRELSDVRVLQRPVDDASTFGLDLEPYRQMDGIWTSRTPTGSASLAGTLSSYTNDGTSDSFEIVSATARLLYSVISVKSRSLTAWRVDGALESLQVRVVGDSGLVYARLGGDRLTRLLATPDTRCDEIDSDIPKARRMFETGRFADSES